MGIDGLNSELINSKVAQYWRVIVTEETTSTQIDLANNFHPGDVLVAEFQSAGRGRLDRKFIVPPRKGLTFSCAIDLTGPILEDINWIPLIAGVATARAINEYFQQKLVQLKWPNDLLIEGKKVGGILSERINFGEVGGVIVGIGLNVFQSTEELPISDSVSLHMFGEVDRNQLLIKILNHLGHSLMQIPLEKDNYRANCATIGNLVRAELPGGQLIEDQAIGISENGSLLLRSREVSVADIVHLR